MITSRLNEKSRTEIPEDVRRALDLRPGDEIACVIENGRVILVNPRHAPDDPFRAFGEWDSEADRSAYGML